jgi:hypothetical protein
VRTGCVEHECVPSFSSCTSYQEQETAEKGLEIELTVQVTLELHKAKSLHSNNRKQE